MMLLALSCALRLASRGKDSDFTVCFALLLGLGVVWIGLRLCLPPPAPPQCPHCRRSALVRLQAQQNRGARCLHCGWRDETADGRLLQSAGGPTADLRGGVQSPRPALAPRHGARQATGPVRSASRPPRGGFGRGRRLR